MITDELKSMGAPARMLEAGQEVEKYVKAGLKPPLSIVLFIRQWVTAQRCNNRYGR